MNEPEHGLVKVIEECNEVSTAAQAISKACERTIKCACKNLRFNPEDEDPQTQQRNRHLLEQEIIDLLAAIERLEECGVDLSGIRDRNRIEKAKFKQLKFEEISYHRGCLSYENHHSG